MKGLAIMNDTRDMDVIVRQALVTLLWSTPHYGDDGEASGCLDATYGVDDIVNDDEMSTFREQVQSFVTDNATDLHGIDDEQVGHDFVLTRNGHGAGFWDRGHGERGDRLTAACKPYGELDAYVGDDGRVYLTA